MWLEPSTSGAKPKREKVRKTGDTPMRTASTTNELAPHRARPAEDGSEPRRHKLFGDGGGPTWTASARGVAGPNCAELRGKVERPKLAAPQAAELLPERPELLADGGELRSTSSSTEAEAFDCPEL